MTLVNVKDGGCCSLIDQPLSRSKVFSQKLNLLPEWGPTTSNTSDNSLRRSFDKDEGTEHFSKYRQREVTKVVEAAGPHSGKEISFMFLFQRPRLPQKEI